MTRFSFLVPLFAFGVPAVAPTQRLILFGLLLAAGFLVVGWSRARG